jgi:hypothetical protein
VAGIRPGSLSVGRHIVTIEQIGRVFRAAPDRQCAVTTLVAAFAVLCAAYTEGLAAEAPRPAGMRSRLHASG